MIRAGHGRQRAVPRRSFFPFHCWRAGPPPVCYSRLFLVNRRLGGPRASLLHPLHCWRTPPTPVFPDSSERFVSEQAALRLVAARTATSRFTVGGHFCSHILDIPEINVRNRAQEPGSLPSCVIPVSLLENIRRCRILDFLLKTGHNQGGTGNTVITRFTVGHTGKARMPESEKPLIFKKG